MLHAFSNKVYLLQVVPLGGINYCSFTTGNNLLPDYVRFFLQHVPDPRMISITFPAAYHAASRISVIDLRFENYRVGIGFGIQSQMVGCGSHLASKAGGAGLT